MTLAQLPECEIRKLRSRAQLVLMASYSGGLVPARRDLFDTKFAMTRQVAAALNPQCAWSGHQVTRMNPNAQKKTFTINGRYTPLQLVFLNSRINGAKYDGDALPVQPWSWPRRTFLQRRLAELRAAKADANGTSST